MYSKEVQQKIVEHYVEIKDENLTLLEEDEEPIDRVGSPWSEEEDEQLQQEFVAGMNTSEIAKKHSRTTGAIRARLKKQGLID